MLLKVVRHAAPHHSLRAFFPCPSTQPVKCVSLNTKRYCDVGARTTWLMPLKSPLHDSLPPSFPLGCQPPFIIFLIESLISAWGGGLLCARQDWGRANKSHESDKYKKNVILREPNSHKYAQMSTVTGVDRGGSSSPLASAPLRSKLAQWRTGRGLGEDWRNDRARC